MLHFFWRIVPENAHDIVSWARSIILSTRRTSFTRMRAREIFPRIIHLMLNIMWHAHSLAHTYIYIIIIIIIIIIYWIRVKQVDYIGYGYNKATNIYIQWLHKNKEILYIIKYSYYIIILILNIYHGSIVIILYHVFDFGLYALL